MKFLDVITERKILWELWRLLPKIKELIAGGGGGGIDPEHKLDADLIDDSTSDNKLVTASDKEAWNNKYDKPETGIPGTDLAEGVIPDISGKSDKIIVVDASTLPSTLDPNKVYSFGTLTGSVTIPAFSSVASGDTEAKIWCFTFNTSTTAPTITWPANITAWSGGNAPTINASKSYEVSVMNGIGVIIEA